MFVSRFLKSGAGTVTFPFVLRMVSSEMRGRWSDGARPALSLKGGKELAVLESTVAAIE